MNIDKIGVYGNAIPFLKVDFSAADLFFDKKRGIYLSMIFWMED
ncbi:hypothetical protein [Flavobacterium sp. DSP2-3-1]